MGFPQGIAASRTFNLKRRRLCTCTFGSPSTKERLGSEFVRRSLRFFFNTFDLQILHGEPFAFNEVPNEALERVGFRFVKQYVTITGPINFEQSVYLWRLSKEDYLHHLG